MEGTRHPDHDSEQRYLRGARAALDASVAHVETLYTAARADKDNPDARALAVNLANRVQRLRDAGAQAPCFARLDDEDHGVLYIGRQHIADASQHPLVIDWRTRAAEPFYRATALNPMGLERRRQFVLDRDELVEIYDTDLTDPHAGAGVPDPLLAEINRSRTGSMREIVATIQAEQDRIVRAPLDRTLVVQGGPGTGKTAVGLHRAAYLLFEHRDQLSRDGVLVVGPNRRFLEYISEVLPSLGERSSRQMIPSDLGDVELQPARELDRDVRRLAGDLRMAALLRGYLHSLPEAPTADVRIRTPLGNATIGAEQAGTHLRGVLAELARFGPARERWMSRVISDLRDDLRARTSGGPTSTASEFAAAVRRSSEFKAFVQQHWPAVKADVATRALWRSAIRDDQLVEAAGFDEAEIQLLRKRPARGPLTEIDRPLLDEANHQLGHRFVRYGHVILDEAQDLSPMALRMVARRATEQSFTVLGDVAQCSGDWHYEDWSVPLRALTTADADVEMAELTVGYRVPGEFIALANRLLPAIAPGLAPTTSVRPALAEPRVSVVAPSELDSWLEHRAVELSGRWSSVAVIDSDADRRARLAPALPTGVDTFAPVESKGLEFDAVVVVEAEAMTVRAGGSWRPLFVALTRAVQHLELVGTERPPAILGLES